MPRPERELVSEDTALLTFAADLRRLREKAGKPTYRQLSSTAHYSVTVLAEAAGGRKLPSLAVTLAYVTACAGNADEWRARWHEVAAELAAAEPPEEPDERRPPYPGLAAFRTGDADRFFGREKLVGELLDLVRDRRFLAVFGASGSGKSSVLRAGLVAGSDHPHLVLTPGPRPREECAVQLAAMTGHPVCQVRTELAADPANLHLYIRYAVNDRDDDLLLVVDQFEEVFTLCRDPAERAWFISALVGAARAETSRARVVLGVRADFYGHCGQYPELIEALRDGQVLVGPLSTDELRRAITQPAVRAGCVIENALTSRLIAEAAGQPAALPLVSHALLETWRRRRGTRLSVAGYEEAGGIQHAVARSADDVFAALEEPGRLMARQIFLRLTALGEGTEDTKRRIARDTLDNDNPDTAQVLERLAAARLITLDNGSVEVTHEALIRSWPRLRGWLSDDREGLRLHRQLTEATDTWEALEQEAGALYRGVRLSSAAEWARTNGAVLTAREQRFLDASMAAEAAERSAERRRTRRLRQIVALLTVLLLVAVGSVAFAVNSQRVVATERNLAIAKKAVADAAALRTENPALSVQLSLAAYRLAPIDETRDNMLSAFATPYGSHAGGHTSDLVSLAFDPHGPLLATASWDRTARLWDVTDVHNPRQAGLIKHDESLKTVAFSSRGRTLATVGENHVRLWDVTDVRTPVHLASFGAVTRAIHWMAFSPDGRTVATAHDDGTARLWDVTDPRKPVERAKFTAHPSGLTSVAFNKDGTMLSTTGEHVARLWDVRDLREPRRLGTLIGHTGVTSSAEFSPDGRTVATSSWDHDVRLWDITNAAEPRGIATLIGHTGLVWSAVFSPDGDTLASNGNGELRLWNITDLTRPRTIVTLPGGAYATAFSPDGNVVADAARDSSVRLQDLREIPLHGHDDVVSSAAINKDGTVLATSSWDRTVRLWDITDPRRRRPLATLTGQTNFSRSVAFSPDGNMLATANDDNTAWLWSVRDPRRPEHIGTVTHPNGEIGSVAFGPDGKVLATGGYQMVRLWNVADQARLGQINGFPHMVWTLAFSADGRTLGTSSPDGKTSPLWDVTDPRRPSAIEFPFTRTDVVPAGAFSRDGRLLATVENQRNVRILDVTDIRRPRQLAYLTGYQGTVYSVAFSPDGRRLATGSADRIVRMWDIAEPSRPQVMGTFNGHTGDVPSVVFSPDGHTLASASNDHTARLWETDIDRLTARICEVAYPRITQPQWEKHFPGLPYAPPCP